MSNQRNQIRIYPNQLKRGKPIEKVIENSDIFKELQIQNQLVDSIKEDVEEQSKLIQDATYDISDIKSTLKNKLHIDDTNLIKRIDNSKNYSSKMAREFKEEIIQSIEKHKASSPQKNPQDYLKKDDFEFSLNQKFEELKESKDSIDALDVLPKKVTDIDTKIDDLSQKIDNLSLNKNRDIQGNIPKEEKSISDLAGFMRDGITQFENISKEYISKESELKNLEILKSSHQKSLKDIEVKSFEEGKKEGEVAFIRNFIENNPSLIKDIKSNFLTQKFELEEVVTINNENKNELSIYFNGTIEIGEYKVISIATLLDGAILIRAEIEKVAQDG